MNRLLTCILAALALATAQYRVLGQALEPNTIIDFQLEEPIKDYKGWRVGRNQTGTRCYAIATFENQTTVWLGVGDAGNDFLIAFANRAWSSVENGKAYDLDVAYNRRNWRGTFSGFIFGEMMGLVSRGLSEKFVIDFGRSAGFEILYQGKSLGRLSLNGSGAALGAAISCARELTKPTDPFAQPPAGADPFAAQASTAGDISLVGGPEIKVSLGPDLPKFGNEWRFGVEEAGLVEAELTSSDGSLNIHFQPSPQENEFPVRCKYVITIYGANDKPASKTVAEWSANRLPATDQQGMVELRFGGEPIRTYTEPGDYYGGRSFEYEFNSDHLAARSLEVAVPSSPDISSAKFEFRYFRSALEYLCGSSRTVGYDGQNAVAPDATSRSGPRPGRCHMDVCSWSVVRSKTVLWSDRRGALLRIEAIGGASEHKNDSGGYPTEFTDKVRVEWDTKLYEYHVFCSKSLPAVIWSTEKDKYAADYIDFPALYGAIETSARLYAEECHRAGLYSAITPEAFAEQFGYGAIPGQGAELASPFDIFNLVK